MTPPNLMAAAAAYVIATPAVVAAAEPSALLYLLGSGGAVGLAALVAKTITDILKGRTKAKQTRHADMEEQRNTAWNERDEERRRATRAHQAAACEARNARRLWDYAAQLRRLLRDAGHPPETIPPDPPLEDCTVWWAEAPRGPGPGER